jgi:DNA (cytosine-5)-methyltransferase 1
MSSYYNEYDKPTAEWLRELIKQNLIPEGTVDDRPIQQVQPEQLRGFTQCHFFTGIGGWPLALRLAGWPDDKPVWTGSCPCQSFSTAGAGRGFDDPRHLWPEFFRLIAECRPKRVFGEQVEAAVRVGDRTQSWLDLVSNDLENAGYSFGSAVFPAAYVGAPHKRERLYFVGHSGGFRGASQVRHFRDVVVDSFWSGAHWKYCPDGKRRAVKPGIPLVAHGIPGHDRLVRGAGNAIVPQMAAEFISAYVEAVT